MLIQVTQLDIDNGMQGRSGWCPVALALKECGFWQAWVGPTMIQLSREKNRLKTSLEISDFINKFDSYGPKAVSPFSFDTDKLELFSETEL